jgi:hypothetical protein
MRRAGTVEIKFAHRVGFEDAVLLPFRPLDKFGWLIVK